jgi:hypothetical protein
LFCSLRDSLYGGRFAAAQAILDSSAAEQGNGDDGGNPEATIAGQFILEELDGAVANLRGATDLVLADPDNAIGGQSIAAATLLAAASPDSTIDRTAPVAC